MAAATKRATPGIRVRHGRACRSRGGGGCNCTPTYEAWIWSVRDGRKIYRSFPSQAAAKGWRGDAASAIRRGALRATSNTTVREAAEAWLEQAERGEVLSRFRRPYKPSALRGYRADFERYVLPDLGAMRLSNVTADDVQALVDRLVGAGLSGSKVRNVLVPLQALYRRHRRQVLVDPTDGLDLPEPGGRRDRVVVPQQAAQQLDVLADDDRALWATAFYAGLRRGELRALRCSDVHGLAGDVDGYLSVERGWDDYAGAIDPKSAAGVRRVPLPETLRVILAAHVERAGRSGDDLMFGRTASEPFTPSFVSDRADGLWAAAAVGAFLQGRSLPIELERVTLHECRHSYSTYLDAAGISETRADRYMGHSNASVANRYRHQLDGQLASDAAQLDGYLAGIASGKVVQMPTGARSGAHVEQSRVAAQTG